MEHILYYNHPTSGYNFYESSPGFPRQYLSALTPICESIADPNTAAIAMRYSKLKDRYVLSVIFRQPEGDALQRRGINTVVNFLMTDQDADIAFSQKPEDMLGTIRDHAIKLLLDRGIYTPTQKPQPICAQNAQIPAPQLLNAATYAGAATLRKQAYFMLETPILHEVAAMLELLPPKLRKHTSFHTGIQNAKESIGIAVSFGSPEMMENAIRGGLAGGQSSTIKYLYQFYSHGECTSMHSDKEGIRSGNQLLQILTKPPYPELTKPLLIDSIDSWQQLERLSALASEEPMAAILSMIPEAAMVQYLQSTTLSEETLTAICSSAQTQHMPQVRKAAQQAIQRQKPVQSPPEDWRAFTGRLSNMFSDPGQEDKAKERKPIVPILLALLWRCIKLGLLAFFVWLAVVLLKGMVDISRVTQEQTVTLMINLNTAKLLWRLLALTGLTAAISSMVTYHITKWSRPHGKEKKAKTRKEKRSGQRSKREPSETDAYKIPEQNNP